MEVIIVLVIIAIAAAIAIPSMIYFTSRAEQTSRMNNARTLFLAAQDALAADYADKQTDIVALGGVDITKIAPSVSAHELDINSGNIAFLYISGEDTDRSSNALIKLLDPYVGDKELLKGTILLEYNNKTGNALGLFYSDTVTRITYNTGMPYCAFARDEDSLRSGNMGYYGVDFTGIEIIDEEPIEISDLMLVDYKGKPEGNDINNGSNYGLLTLEYTLPEKPDRNNYEFSITDEAGTAYSFSVKYQSVKHINSLASALSNPQWITVSWRDGRWSRSETGRFPIYVDNAGYLVIVLDYMGRSYTSITENFPGIEGHITATATASYGQTSITAGPSNSQHTLFDDSTDGTQNVITSIRHLNNVRESSSDTYVQTADVYVHDFDRDPINFEPIAFFISGFSGSYSGGNDAKNYTIYDLSVNGASYAGLFDTVAGDGSVEYLSFAYTDAYTQDTSNSYILPNGSGYGGSVAAVNYGSIDHCSVSTVLQTGMRSGLSLGCICGENNGTVSNCTSDFSSTSGTGSANRAGGITGENYGEISSCVSNGSLIFTGTSSGRNAYAGGVAGENLYDASVTGCISSVDITNYLYSGGIVGNNGYSAYASGSSALISGCSYDGSITSQLNNAEIGGIAGESSGVVSGCSVSGSLTGYYVSADVPRRNDDCTDYIGGVVGDNYRGTVKDCTDISVSVSNGKYIGGVTGYNYASSYSASASSVTNCKNVTSVISGGKYMGGITGDNGSNSNITDCEFSGTLRGERANAYTGGIAGRSARTIRGCTVKANASVNTGSASTTAGGICGMTGTSSLIDSCTCSAPVTGGVYAGGIAGQNNNDITGCTVGGSVISTAANGTAGGVAADSSSISSSITGCTVGTVAVMAEQSEGVSGGICGRNEYSGYYSDSMLTDCTSGAAVKAYSLAGGVVGSNAGTVRNCDTLGACSAETTADGSRCGGTVGYNFGSVTGCDSLTAVTCAAENSAIGGVAGENAYLLEQCGSAGAMIYCDKAGTLCGGIAGINVTQMTSCVSSRNIMSAYLSGGLAGRNIGRITGCTSAAGVVGTGSGAAGCAAGENTSSGVISACSLSGTVSSPTAAGGAAGFNAGRLAENSFDGSVSGTNGPVGGLAGNNSGSISKCSSSGTVSAVSADAGTAYTGTVGGIAGISSGTVTYSTSVSDVTSQSGSAGGIAGENAAGGTVSYCLSSADVLSSSVSGGIAGKNSGNITYCEAGVGFTGDGAFAIVSIAGRYADAAGYVYKPADPNVSIKNDFITVTASGADCIAGGIAGLVSDNGTVSYCVNACMTVSEFDDASVTPPVIRGVAGGLVGSLTSSQPGALSLSYNAGSVYGAETAGGVCGSADGGIVSCYNTGFVNTELSETGGTYSLARINSGAASGGIAGACGSAADVSSCYSVGFSGGENEGAFGVMDAAASVQKCAFLDNGYNTAAGETAGSVLMLSKAALADTSAYFTLDGLTVNASAAGVGEYAFIYEYIDDAVLGEDFHRTPYIDAASITFTVIP